MFVICGWSLTGQGKQLPEDKQVESLKFGRSWPKCFKKHQDARKEIAERFGKEAPPPHSRTGDDNAKYGNTIQLNDISDLCDSIVMTLASMA